MKDCEHCWIYIGSNKQLVGGFLYSISIEWCEICGTVHMSTVDQNVDHYYYPNYLEKEQ